MRIVQAAVEFAPIAKAGGLGEVVTGLSRELSRTHHDLRVFLPKYDFLKKDRLAGLRLETPSFTCQENGKSIENSMWSVEIEGCKLYLLETKHPALYFQRGKLYGCEDDAARFLYFSRAVLEFLKSQNTPIDILHVHDWHTAPMAPLARSMGVKIKATVLSIHNVEYQGKCAPHELEAVGLQPKEFLDPVDPGTMNLLKGSLSHVDAIVAVSPSYAEEILSPQFGFSLDVTLREQKAKLSGILNGIDLELWDPSKDPALRAHYSSEDAFTKVQDAKRKTRETLGASKQMPQMPWFGAISRLVPQKGPELIEEAIHWAVSKGALFALLGSSPIPTMQRHFEELKRRYHGHAQVLIHLDYDEALAHKLYAALHFFIVPSHFEPCGLSQLIAMHYGTVPIVRATGGLKDTVFDQGDSKTPASERNGFVFKEPTAEALKATLERALHLWQTDQPGYQSLVRRGMKANVGWREPAMKYHRLFLKLQR